MSVVYLEGNDDMISARLGGFVAPKSKAEPGKSISFLEALTFSACSSYCFLCVMK